MPDPIVIRATVKTTVIRAGPVTVGPTIRAAPVIALGGDAALAVLENTPDLTIKFEESL